MSIFKESLLRWKQTYASGEILRTKIDIHEKYSSVPIDIPQEIRRLLKMKGEEDLLDIGCGTGHFLEKLRMSGHSGKLLGVDIASGGFGRAENLAREMDVFLLQADARRLPFQGASFEFVTALHMLSHAPKLGPLMSEVKRVLNSGGVFLATANSFANYPHVAGYRRRVFGKMGWGQPMFTTNVFNTENAECTLSPYWRSVKTEVMAGELKIPISEFTSYFSANIAVWDVQPNNDEEKDLILTWVSQWANEDAKDGYIVEPKWVSFSVCRD